MSKCCGMVKRIVKLRMAFRHRIECFPYLYFQIFDLFSPASKQNLTFVYLNQLYGH